MANAHVEILSAIVRVFPDGKEYGDEYEFFITVRGLNPHTVEIVGANQAPTGDQIRAIRKALNAVGITKAVWKRFRLGGVHTVEVK